MGGRVAVWLREHPWVVTAFSGGVLLALLLCLPLIPYSLPDSTANVFGAAFGAIVAVWGAAWVADRKERLRDDSAAVAVWTTAQPTLIHAQQALAALQSALQVCKSGAGRPLRVEAIRAAIRPVEMVDHTTARFDERLQFMAPLFLQLGGTGVMAQGFLSSSGPLLRAMFKSLRWGAYYDDTDAFAADLERLNADVTRVLGRCTYALRMLRSRARVVDVPADLGEDYELTDRPSASAN